jgi:hypothetical protein
MTGGPDAAPDRACQRILPLSGDKTPGLRTYGEIPVVRDCPAHQATLSSRFVWWPEHEVATVSLNFIKPEKLLLAGHPEYGEKWVQERIAEDPSILKVWAKSR